MDRENQPVSSNGRTNHLGVDVSKGLDTEAAYARFNSAGRNRRDEDEPQRPKPAAADKRP